MRRFPTLRMIFLVAVGVCFGLAKTNAQIAGPDLIFPEIPDPAYEIGSGPLVLVDEAHSNAHVVEGSDVPFAEYLRRDGYRIARGQSAFTADLLEGSDVLVVPMPLPERNQVRGDAENILNEDSTDWSRPHESAFTDEEIVVVHRWVESGGSLLLVADHPPVAGAVSDLAAAFGFSVIDGFARDTLDGEVVLGAMPFRRDDGSLNTHPITDGRNESERVDEIFTFGGLGFTGGAELEPLLTLRPEAISRPDRSDSSPRTPIGGSLQGAVLEHGEGRVAFFGEGGMFFATLNSFNLCPAVTFENVWACFDQPGYVVKQEQNPQLLLNVMHWLTRVID